ncbi:hypothetical protein [Actinopolymorpha singaporensis]|uniref:Uncharacterized protein n=1 Tax=Actinopolymorpha singaporensis TaxID=117157 RepID=A0A1H1LA41_9ACTN|nr:hypothetical protein [Actinopolymorpha singaporensis]SDR71220.1 hypothetical protein SAMN04489717_0206 [Actinopolymorpha singaporensis]
MSTREESTREESTRAGSTGGGAVGAGAAGGTRSPRARRRQTHPLVPGAVLVLAALAVPALTYLWAFATAPVLLAWVVLALAAGYSISGSV